MKGLEVGGVTTIYVFPVEQRNTPLPNTSGSAQQFVFSYILFINVPSFRTRNYLLSILLLVYNHYNDETPCRLSH